MESKLGIKSVLIFVVLFCIKLYSSYTPEMGELSKWKPTGPPCQYVGEDLFLLINGGAEIYHEYGFKQVITREYKNMNGKIINLEVFEMVNSASAFGMYSFKTGINGEEIFVGNNGMLEDYYINFWKGNFLVTLTGFDSDNETREGLIIIARAVNKKIKNKGKTPFLTGLLPGKDLKKSRIKYIKGYLGLFNLYKFSHEDIFGIKDGVMGDYSDFIIFIFRYNTEKESQNWFKNAQKKMKKNTGFFDFTVDRCAFYLKGKKGEHIYVKPYGNYIIVYIGTEQVRKRRFIIKKIEDNINSSKSNINYNRKK